MSIRFDGNQLVEERVGRGIGIFSVVLMGRGEGDLPKSRSSFGWSLREDSFVDKNLQL
jgi:hypothetical protein